MIKNKIEIVIEEISGVLSDIDECQVKLLINKLIESEKIVIIGAGRVGLVAKTFAMRLMHLGMDIYTLNDCNLPAIEKKDLLIVCSGSGETQTIYDLTLIAKRTGVKIMAITGNLDSKIAKLADFLVEIKAPFKTKIASRLSVQPMTTLMEQSLFLFFDALVLELMDRMNINSDLMKNRHSILE